MTQHSHAATSLLSLAVILTTLGLLVAGSSQGRAAGTPGRARSAAPDPKAQPPCGAATDHTYLSTSLAVALRISEGERQGAEVTRAVNTIEADQALATAVAADDVAEVVSEVHALVFNHEHIVRLRVLRDGRVLDDLGGPFVLAPVTGSLRVGGQVVGTFVMSVQDDAGYAKLAQRLVGADAVLRYQGQTVLSDLALGDEPLPRQGTLVAGNVTYLVASFDVGHFPDGLLSVSLLLPRPAAALARESCAQVAAGVLIAVARRVYVEAQTSPWWVGGPLAALARTTTLASALGAGDDSEAADIVRAMFEAGGFARLRVVAGGRVIADLGESVPLVAPITRPLIDGAGQLVGEATFAVEPAQSYANLAHSLVRVPLLVRAGDTQLAGSFAGPARLPSSGELAYDGARYAVASFPGRQFPDVAARIYVLAPG